MAKIVGRLKRDSDGIFSTQIAATGQSEERNFRDSVAHDLSGDYLAFVGRHHSIRVMDREVERFLPLIPANGVIVDVGGGWGWHWRNLGILRPDVGVVIVDFVR